MGKFFATIKATGFSSPISSKNEPFSFPL